MAVSEDMQSEVYKATALFLPHCNEATYFTLSSLSQKCSSQEPVLFMHLNAQDLKALFTIIMLHLMVYIAIQC